MKPPSKPSLAPRIFEDSGRQQLIKVASGTSVPDLASVISHAIYDNRQPVLQGIGAGPNYQGLKAVAAARGYVAPRGLNLSIIPAFVSITGNTGEEITALQQIIVATF